MKLYLRAFFEFFKDWLFLTFLAGDIIGVLLGLTGKTNFEPPVYMALLLTGIFISSLRLIVQKNIQIEKSEGISNSLRDRIEKTRPYLRLSWDVTQLGNNRREQGITDTCIVITNCGNKVMRNVNYNVKVNGKKVGVRSHTSIDIGGSTCMVYDSINQVGEVLGSRNNNDYAKKNNEIIQTEKITISGTYRDTEGKQYSFSFISDASVQSWFKEVHLQKRIN